MGIMARLFGRVERRESQPFTDAIVSALAAQAGGVSIGDPGGLAALEVAAGLYSRAFADATVEGSPAAVAALTPQVRSLIARDVIRRGESVHLIEVEDGGIRLAPAGSWDVRGNAPEASWWYRADLFGPSGNVTRHVPGAAVVHCRWAVDPSRPWYGISPLGWARLSATLAANLETRLGEEAGGAVAHLLPIPLAEPDGDAADDDTDPLAQIRKDIAAARGRTAVVETTAAGWGEGKAAAPQADWQPRRIGADPPATLAELRSDSGLWVLGACGVPPSLATMPADGTGQREGWRRFLHGSVEPLGKLVAAELSAKLGGPVRLNFDSLFASDLSGRARAFQSMVGGGMDVGKAAALAGLMGAE